MRVSIFGAGAIALGTAALLTENGHEVTLRSPSGKRARSIAETGAVTAAGAIAGRFEVAVAQSDASAVGTAEAVLVALPANGHRAVFDAIAPHLQDGQTVIVSSHASFGALYLDRLLKQRGVDVPIVAWGTTAVTARQTADDTVQVNTVRARIDLASLPATWGEKAKTLCTRLFGERFVLREDLLAIALSNLNPQNHLGIALLNLTRMERGEAWGQGENVTPTVGRVLEALDKERLAIADALGLQVRTIFEHFHLSFHVPVASISDMNQQLHRDGRGSFGPTTTESRYVLEDVPFGLAPVAHIGRLVGRPAKLHEAGIALLSAAYGRDLEEDNDLMPVSGVEGLSVDELRTLAREGSPARLAEALA